MINDRDVGRLADRHHVENFVCRVRRPVAARIDRRAEQRLRRARKRIEFHDAVLQLAVRTLDQAEVRDRLAGRRGEILKFDLQLIGWKRRIRVRALEAGEIIGKIVAGGCRHETDRPCDNHRGEGCACAAYLEITSTVPTAQAENRSGEIRDVAVGCFRIFKAFDPLDPEKVAYRVDGVMRVAGSGVRDADEKVAVTSHFAVVDRFVI